MWCTPSDGSVSNPPSSNDQKHQQQVPLCVVAGVLDTVQSCPGDLLSYADHQKASKDTYGGVQFVLIKSPIYSTDGEFQRFLTCVYLERQANPIYSLNYLDLCSYGYTVSRYMIKLGRSLNAVMGQSLRGSKRKSSKKSSYDPFKDQCGLRCSVQRHTVYGFHVGYSYYINIFCFNLDLKLELSKS